MNDFSTHLCAICGEERSPSQPRFLVAENIWEDKLTILEWNEEVASRAGIQVACGIGHVEELLIAWLTSGRLDYPFARTRLGAATWRHMAARGSKIDLSGARALGELAVHRESVERILVENPQSLKVILDVLLDALRLEIASDSGPLSVGHTEGEQEQGELCGVITEPECKPRCRSYAAVDFLHTRQS